MTFKSLLHVTKKKKENLSTVNNEKIVEVVEN